MGVTAESREDLQYVKPGQPITARKFNALIDFVRGTGRPTGPDEWEDQRGGSRRKSVKKEPELWVRCTSLVTANPWSVVEIYDSQLLDDGLTFKVRQATSSAQMFAGCEEYPLINGGSGWVKLINPYAITKVMCYGTAGFLNELQPNGLGVITGNGGQFMCMGSPDNGGRVPVLSLSGSPILVGQTTTTHSKGTTQTVNIFRGPTKGSEIHSSSDTVQAYNRFATVASGKWVAVAFINEGWELISAEC